MPKKKPKEALRQALLKNDILGEALRRNPDFRRECDVTLEHFWRGRQAELQGKEIHDPHVLSAFRDYSREAQDLAESWQLAEPWHYLDPGPPLFQEFYVTRVIPAQKAEYAIYQKNHNLTEGKRLVLEIDLSKPLDQILAAVTLRYHRHVAKEPGRGMSYKETDMWQAYDLIEQGITDIQTTWRLFPKLQGNYPSSNSEMDKHLKKVKRWHRKAQKLISDISRLRK